MMVTQQEVDEHEWFHGLNLGTAVTKGRVQPENWSIYPILSFLEDMDLSGACVLDVGTMDGLVAFIAEQEGAAEVHATDLYARSTFEVAKAALGASVIYHPRTSIESLLERFGRQSFDVVVMAGLMYHLLSPLRCCLIARNLLRKGGTLLLETVCVHGNEPKLTFNPSARLIDEYTTFFVPTVPAVEGMLEFSCFDCRRVSSVSRRDYGRTSFAAIACLPGELEASSDLMRRTIDRANKSQDDFLLDELSLANLTTDQASRVPAISAASATSINPDTFSSRFALQP